MEEIIFWLYQDEQELNSTFRITHLPNEKKEVCALQLKGNNVNSTSGNKRTFPFRLQSRWHPRFTHYCK